MSLGRAIGRGVEGLKRDADSRRVHLRARDQSGFGMLELLMAMVMLNVGILALVGAVVILLLGLFLFRAEVIHDPSVALWPTYSLLQLDTLPSVQAPETWFPYGVHVLIWTAALYGVIAVFERAQKR